MSDNLDENRYHPRVKKLYRSFSFEFEARISTNAPSDQLARIVVEDRKRGELWEEELTELRRNFEPWEIAE